MTRGELTALLRSYFSPRATMSPQLQLVVWDFDNSMIDENTDTFIFDRLAPDLADRMGELSSTAEFKTEWTRLCDHMLGALHGEKGVGPAALTAAVAEAPAFDECIEAVHALAAAGIEQRILSDANTVYISAILEKRGLAPLFDSEPPGRVVTNPAQFDGAGRLRVQAYHDATDAAVVDQADRTEFCGKNLAKGAVLRPWLEALPAGATCLYVGDGRGDFGAAVQLRECDTLCCRTGYALERIMAGKGKGRVAAQVSAWADGKELLAAIMQAAAEGGADTKL
jgi:pyridoxal phosphate phosphatase PHOSPHO2